MGSIDKQYYNSCLERECGRKKRLFKQYPESVLAVLYIRKAQYYRGGKVTKLISSYYLRKLIRRYGIFIHPDTKIGAGLHLPHPNGIIIGKDVEIGENCTIYQQVTIGSAAKGDWLKSGMQPKLGDNCIIFSGAKIIGRIKLGNGTTVGANAVLNKDTEPDSVWAGIPAKRIK